MLKAILVMDMPSKCSECKFHYETRDEDDDFVDKCQILDKTIDGYTEKYSGCPLQELPKHKTDSLANTRYKTGWVWGYNACLDEILGE